MKPSRFSFFAPPSSEGALLTERPRLESWDAAGHPSQLALTSFLDHAESVARHEIVTVPEPWSVLLRIGLADQLPLTAGGHDLDNYAFPVARRLGHRSLSAVYAEKARGDSRLTLGPAAVAEHPGDGWAFTTASSSASAQTRRWKEEIADTVRRSVRNPFPMGSVELHLAFAVSDQRNWTTLWKPAIDALVAILGCDPRRPSAPLDDRVVRLGLHRTIDNDLGWRVELGIWWRLSGPADG